MRVLDQPLNTLAIHLWYHQHSALYVSKIHPADDHTLYRIRPSHFVYAVLEFLPVGFVVVILFTRDCLLFGGDRTVLFVLYSFRRCPNIDGILLHVVLLFLCLCVSFRIYVWLKFHFLQIISFFVAASLLEKIFSFLSTYF